MIGSGIERFDSVYEKQLIKGTEGIGLIIGVIISILLGSGILSVRKETKEINEIIKQLEPILKNMESKIYKCYQLYTNFVNTVIRQIPIMFKKSGIKIFEKLKVVDESMLSEKYVVERIVERIARNIHEYRHNNLSPKFDWVDIGTVLVAIHDKNATEDEYYKYGHILYNILEKLNTKNTHIRSGDGDLNSSDIEIVVRLDISKQDIAQWSSMLEKK